MVALVLGEMVSATPGSICSHDSLGAALQCCSRLTEKIPLSSAVSTLTAAIGFVSVFQLPGPLQRFPQGRLGSSATEPRSMSPVSLKCGSRVHDGRHRSRRKREPGQSRLRMGIRVGRLTMVLGLIMCFGHTGCGAAEPRPAVQQAAEPARAAVATFLEAIKRGDEKAALAMLTQVARQKTQELGLSVAPPVNDTASYAIQACEVIGEAGDIVHVGTTWTDTDPDGFTTTDNVVWVCRLDPEGWRVVGMAMRIFEDLPPLILDFEDPEDMVAKQELVADELNRRASMASQSRPQSGDRTAEKPSPGTQRE